MSSHEWIDQRSLAVHEAVANKLAEHPEWLEVARQNLRQWLARNPQPPLLAWQRLLDTLAFDELLELLRCPDERARRLRQSSPFAGVLTHRDRQAHLVRYHSHAA